MPIRSVDQHARFTHGFKNDTTQAMCHKNDRPPFRLRDYQRGGFGFDGAQLTLDMRRSVAKEDKKSFARSCTDSFAS
jgi:hypothetical protein